MPKRQKFARRLSVKSDKMTIDKAVKTAHQHIKEMSRVMVSYTTPRVNYWYDSKTGAFIIAYHTDIEWKWWYKAWLDLGNSIIIGFYKVRRWLGWRSR